MFNPVNLPEVYGMEPWQQPLEHRIKVPLTWEQFGILREFSQLVHWYTLCNDSRFFGALNRGWVDSIAAIMRRYKSSEPEIDTEIENLATRWELSILAEVS